MGPKLIWGASLDLSAATDTEHTLGALRQGEDGRIWRWIKNNDSVTLIKGQAVAYDVAQSGETIQKYVKAMTTAALPMFAGVLTADIPAGYYGYVLCYGQCDYALVLGPATSGGTAAIVGRYYKPVNAQTYLADDGASTPASPRSAQMLEAIATVTTPATATKKVFIRAM